MGAALAGLLALAACSEPEQQTATGPEFRRSPPPPSTACDFGAVKDLVNSYFSPPAKQTAQDLQSQMETAGKQTASAVTNGFAILDLIGKTSRSDAPPSPVVGSNLTKAVIKCMFDASQSEYTDLVNGGGLDAVRFDNALSASTGGVYYVVGQGYDTPGVPGTLKGATSPALIDRLSAVAPGPATFSATDTTTFTTGNWTDALAGNTLNHQGGRALFYGYPVTTNPIVFEWATITPSTTFSPYAIVSICDGLTDKNLMVHESNLGVLAFSRANLCERPDATAITKSGFRSEFKDAAITNVTVAWLKGSAPPGRVKMNTDFTAVARVTSKVEVDGTLQDQGVNGVCLTLTGSNNNGQGTFLVGPEACGKHTEGDSEVSAVTDTGPDGAGYATFTLHVTDTGNLFLTLTGDVVDREGQTSNSVVTKTNVVP
jgi:hypothetical protein